MLSARRLLVVSAVALFIGGGLTSGGRGAAAQVPWEGRIVDAERGTPLPGATVQIRTTDQGDAADADGRVSLTIEALPVELVARFVGYAPAVLPLTEPPATGTVQTVRLEPTADVIGAVVVTAEAPGDRLLRRVIARKQVLAARTGSYVAEGYGRLLLQRRGQFDPDSTPVRFSETLSNVAWQRDLGSREEVVARWRVPEGGPFRYADLEAVPDVYLNDIVTLDGATYPSPVHPEALQFYRFRIGETRVENGRRLIDLAVIPKGRDGLAGRIRVVDSLLVLAEAELRPNVTPAGGLVTAFDATYRVTFGPVRTPALGDSLWLPTRFERTGSVQVARAVQRLPRVLFHQVTRVDRHRVGASVGPSLQRWPEPLWNPVDVFGGRSVFAPYRARFPISEKAREVERTLADRTLADLLPPEGFTFGGLLGVVGRIPVEGSDDPR